MRHDGRTAVNRVPVDAGEEPGRESTRGARPYDKEADCHVKISCRPGDEFHTDCV